MVETMSKTTRNSVSGSYPELLAREVDGGRRRHIRIIQMAYQFGESPLKRDGYRGGIDL